MRIIWIAFLAGAIALVASASLAQTVTLEPFKNNTLYESETGSLSNAVGRHTFIGLTGEPRITRTLLAFDVRDNVPAGSTITRYWPPLMNSVPKTVGTGNRWK